MLFSVLVLALRLRMDRTQRTSLALQSTSEQSENKTNNKTTWLEWKYISLQLHILVLRYIYYHSTTHLWKPRI